MNWSLYSYSATLIAIVTSVIVAIVRWFHLCHPYDQNPDYFYPSRRFVTGYFFAVLLLTPYLFHWDSPDTWLFTRCFYIIYIPSFGAVALQNYFFIDIRRRIIHYCAIGLIPSILFLPLFILACIGDNYLEDYYTLVSVTAVIVSLFVLTDLTFITTNLFKRIKDFLYGEYSNEDDFPIHFAKGVVFLPLSLWTLSFIVFIADNETVLACLNIILSVVSVGILIFILHPHRTECHSIENTTAKTINNSQGSQSEKLEDIDNIQSNVEMTETMLNQIEKQIRKAVEGQRLFLDSRFKREDLARCIGTNRTYLSIVFRKRFSSFYSYINTLRIEYSIHYQEEHPEANNLEIAIASGFGSVRSYLRIKMLFESREL